jgi:hypothetical protein
MPTNRRCASASPHSASTRAQASSIGSTDHHDSMRVIGQNRHENSKNMPIMPKLRQGEEAMRAEALIEKRPWFPTPDSPSHTYLHHSKKRIGFHHLDSRKKLT